MDRRTFLLSSGLIAVAPSLGWERKKILVAVQLLGGNDGLNTVIPYQDPAYRRCRPTLGIAPHEVIALDGKVGLHPAMAAAARLFQQEKLTIIQNVGAVAHDRSHVRNQLAWSTGTLEVAGKVSGSGWLARAVQGFLGGWECRAVGIGPREAGLAIAGCHSASVASDGSWSVAKAAGPQGRLAQVDQSIRSRLDLVADLIQDGSHARVYSTAQEGYDTHVLQRARHAGLLAELWEAVERFQMRLVQMGRSSEVLLLIYSEFGRSVWENKSQGTDHGYGGPVFLVGERVRGGIVGPGPDLPLDFPGEPEPAYSFLDVQAAILEDWFGIAAARIVPRRAHRLEVLA